MQTGFVQRGLPRSSPKNAAAPLDKTEYYSLGIIPPGLNGRSLCGGARAIRDSPPDVGAWHRVVRRHTCCSPVTRRSAIDASDTSARAALGVHVGQPAPKAASKVSHEARRSSEECVGSHASHRPNGDFQQTVCAASCALCMQRNKCRIYTGRRFF